MIIQGQKENWSHYKFLCALFLHRISCLLSFKIHSTGFSPNLQLTYGYGWTDISMHPAFLLTLMPLLLIHTLWCHYRPCFPLSLSGALKQQ